MKLPVMLGAAVIAAVGGVSALPLSAPFLGQAVAQTTTEEGGGHEDGGEGDDGGHSGGHGGGHGGEETAVLTGDHEGNQAPEVPPAADRATGALRADYFRLELGVAAPEASDAFWLPPGYPTDPKIIFAPELDRTGFASVAFGRHFPNNLRAEVALTGFWASDFTADWTSSEPSSPGPHASMAGSTSSVALMANGYYDLDNTLMGPFRPFVSAGVGVSNNSMGTWSRLSPKGDVREYEGANTLSLAWSVGAGVSVALGPIGGMPSRLDIAYRYYDLGQVEGSAVPVSGESGGQPVQPLTFDKTEQTVSVSLRVYF